MDYSLNILLAKLEDYISNNITVNEFCEWFNPLAWEIESYDDQELIDLVYEIDLIFGEATHGVDSIDEEYFRKEIELITRKSKN